jgi:pSer/pThr/pTyr-binding forkhead associated (FHA) protein
MTEWVLVITPHGQSSHTMPCADGVIFGRSSKCSCVLSDVTVSGAHARILERDGRLVLEDLGSENKTRISGGPTLSEGEMYVLKPGTVFQMGLTVVELRNDKAVPGKNSFATTSDPTRATPLYDEVTAVQGPPEPEADESARWGRTTQIGTPDKEETTQPKSDDDASPATSVPLTPPQPAAVNEPLRVPPVPTQDPHSSAGAESDLDDSGSYGRTIDFGAGDGSGLHAKLAAEGSLLASHARLVLASLTDRRVEPITTARFTIGRGKESRCRLSHLAISTPHATITFEPNESRFFVRDDGSRNHTYLGGKLIGPGVPHELTSNTHLRFGPVDALFLVEIDPDGVKLPEGRQQLAAQILMENGTITAAQKNYAEKQARDRDQQLGEALLLSPEPITVKHWVNAMEQAKYLEIVSGRGKQPTRIWVATCVVLLLVSLILFVISRL